MPNKPCWFCIWISLANLTVYLFKFAVYDQIVFGVLNLMILYLPIQTKMSGTDRISFTQQILNERWKCCTLIILNWHPLNLALCNMKQICQIKISPILICWRHFEHFLEMRYTKATYYYNFCHYLKLENFVWQGQKHFCRLE